MTKIKNQKLKPIKFTLPRLEALEPRSHPYEIADTIQPGLSCRVLPTGIKTLQVHKRPVGSNKLVRVKICKVGGCPLDHKRGVREQAADIVKKLSAGINPNEERRLSKALESADQLTLRNATDLYITAAKIKPNTEKSYKAVIHNHLNAWLDLPLNKITGLMVTAKHNEISKKTPIAANNTMRVLRAIFNHAQSELEDDITGDSPIPNSPTRKLKRKWNRETRKQTYIKPDSLKGWWVATEAIAKTRKGTRREAVPVYKGGDGVLARDYLQFVILTGLRRREASGLTWDHVDLKNKVFVVAETKNSTPLELPLSDYLVDMLQRRKKITGGKQRPFHIEEVKKFTTWVGNECNNSFTVHDLRRTFITYAESLDFGAYTLKALINHRSGGDPNDVTAGYVIINTERLRKPMQQITDFILKMAEVKETPVVAINGSQP